MVTTADIKKDVILKWNNELYAVTDFQHVNPGKGSAFVRTKIRNLRTGKIFEETLKAGEAVDIVEVEKKRMNYLYNDATGFYFMDNQTYEQVVLPRAALEDNAGLLKEGMEAMILLYENSPISIELPKKVTLKVAEATPAVRGNTAGGNVTKEVTLETGYKIRVPMFIKEGDMIILNTETGEYVERA